MAASTARTCLRRDGDSVHSQKRDHASARERGCDMVGTLARRSTMEKLALLADLGVKVEWLEDNTVALQADEIGGTEVDPGLAERIRASFLVAGPLLARFGSALMPPPGGDVIGRRRLDPHLDAFRALGAEVHHDRHIRLSAPNGGLRPADFYMDEPS